MTRWVPRERIWPMIIGAVLLLDVAVGVTLIRVAGNDPTGAIEPDYYRKAVTWDSTMAQADRNRALGWTVSPALDAIGDRSRPTLSVILHDAEGVPITGARVRVEAMPIAHANDVLEAALAEGDSGRYEARLPVEASGLWEVRMVARRGRDRFTADFRLDATPGRAARLVTGRPWEATPDRVQAGIRPPVAGAH